MYATEVLGKFGDVHVGFWPQVPTVPIIEMDSRQIFQLTPISAEAHGNTYSREKPEQQYQMLEKHPSECTSVHRYVHYLAERETACYDCQRGKRLETEKDFMVAQG